MKLSRNGTAASAKGPEAWFTGTVRLDAPFAAEAPANFGGAIVTFEPGARTNWHTHPLGQLLIVTAGLGWAQTEGGAVQELRPGDTVWFGPDERHWHGATDRTAMTHIAIAAARDGVSVVWGEPVTGISPPQA